MAEIAFSSPPLTEVVFGLRFAHIEQWRASSYGLFWQGIREDYPEYQDQAPIEPVSPPSAGLWPLPRAWYVHRQGQLLLQVQPNGMWFNWRQLDRPEAYPRYATLKPQFLEMMERLSDFLAQENLGILVPGRVELSYINMIPGRAGESLAELGGRVFRDLAGVLTGVSAAKDLRSLEFRSGSTSGRMALKIQVQAGPLSESPGIPAIRLDIATGSVGEITARDIPSLLDDAHSTIVQSFTELTRPEMHDEWKRDR